MSDATRAKALEKMAGFRVKIGYPDEWIDYGALTLDASAPYYTNVLAAKRFEFERTLKRINAPVDKTMWFMAPQQARVVLSIIHTALLYSHSRRIILKRADAPLNSYDFFLIFFFISLNSLNPAVSTCINHVCTAVLSINSSVHNRG